MNTIILHYRPRVCEKRKNKNKIRKLKKRKRSPSNAGCFWLLSATHREVMGLYHWCDTRWKYKKRKFNQLLIIVAFESDAWPAGFQHCCITLSPDHRWWIRQYVHTDIPSTRRDFSLRLPWSAPISSNFPPWKDALRTISIPSNTACLALRSYRTSKQRQCRDAFKFFASTANLFAFSASFQQVTKPSVSAQLRSSLTGLRFTTAAVDSVALSSFAFHLSE